ncbi:C4-dicarboxylate transporter, DcuC family [Selenomonas ruminantium]|jgi:DcuC family C4-dicarboxylate transporter|uniref:C4-dicarboxylate transporter, DcuC family n=1 Tax=Selenomonas ruminantium TaxID=971 RepID=A0A1I3DES4_SELRU|nr:C4-dicarboxylate transporter DcuC [Selenomonas ruminantium]MBE6075057.1 C4-dicarboxylate ABC transporter [Selenomonas ruminantium]SFH85079.1 C4-dicarboxylate transporter, DcuC family [Selenomonas ruminantium]
MLIAGGILVILTFVLIVKKYEARLVLFSAGLIMCLIGGLPGDVMKAFTKAMVNNSLVPTICTVMGFSYVMKLTQCDQHLVQSISGILKRGRALLVPLSFLLTWWISLAIPSASGCSAAVGSILIPTLIAAGVHPAMAAATVLAGTWGSAISPGNAHNPFVADLAGTDMMTVILNETPASIAASIACIAVMTAYAFFFHEGASAERSKAYQQKIAAEEHLQLSTFKVNPLRALVPIVPLFLLILGSKQVAVLPEISVPLSMLIGVALGLIVTWSDAQEVCRNFFKGMGSAYSDVIGLIVCASVFTTGMTAIGLTGALTDLMKGSESIAAAAGTFGPFFIAVISGSGDAAAFAFNGAVTPYAEQFGMSIMDLGSLAQIAGAMGRSMSPVAGAAIICAGLAKVNPIEVSKRNALPCLAAAIVLMILL